MIITLLILKWGVLITSILDSWKYRFLALKVKHMKCSKAVSRKFLNISIIYRIFLLAYSALVLKDWIIGVSCIIALLTLFETHYYTYIYYPYKYRGLKNFKRPSVLKYILNSLVLNKYASKL